MLEASQKLLKVYPEYGSISTKKTGMTEFRLRKIPNQKTKKNEKTAKHQKTMKRR